MPAHEGEAAPIASNASDSEQVRASDAAPSADELMPFVELARLYAAGALTALSHEEWRRFEALAEEPLALRDPTLAHIVERIARPDARDAETFPYAFNRLFVGPDRLLAAPYETVHVSGSRTLMQRETLAVRACYRAEGFEPRALNAQPDDHLAFELGFLVKLLERDDERAREAFRAFMRDHLGRWGEDHTREVREHADNGICLAFADLLDRVIALCRQR